MSGNDVASATVGTRAGPYVVGEKTGSLSYSFLDSSGNPIDLTAFTAKFVVREELGSAVEYDAVVTAPAQGTVSYTWTGTEFPTAGSYLSEFWVGNGSLRYASILVRFDVRAAVGPVPGI